MKRKVIQIADSTQLISLPRKWAQKFNIKKGDELEVEEHDNKIVVLTSNETHLETADLNIDDLEPLTARVIHALYKRGLDEIKIYTKNQQQLEIVQKALGKETVGFEIVEQGTNFCLIKNVSGNIEEFDQLLKRTFLMLITMAEEGLKAIKAKNYEYLKNVALLEESNNRFTTSCRRYLNKKGHNDYKVGPVYFIVESLENTADQFKYMFTNLSKTNPKLKINDNVLKLYQEVNNSISSLFKAFYKYDKKELVDIGSTRLNLVEKFHGYLKKTKSYEELIIIHHLVNIQQMVFNMIGPLIAMKKQFG